MALPRFFSASPKSPVKQAGKRAGKKSPKNNLGYFSNASPRGPRKALRIERPTWRDKFRKGEAPVREAVFTLAGFFAMTLLYGLIIGGSIEKLAHGMHGVLASAARMAGFGIREVRVAGGSRLTGEEITSLLDLEQASALTLDVNAARQRFLQVPWIKSASVRLLMPGTIEVSLAERTPFALWQRAGAVAMIDRDGRNIGSYTDARFSSLPLVVGDGADAQAGPLLEEIARYPALQSRMRAAILVANRRWNLKFSEGIDIKLPEKNFDAALATLAKLDKDDALLNRDITIVDLRLPDRVIVRLSEASFKQRLDMIRTRSGSYNKNDPIAQPKTEGSHA
jgi:cell division protein FtsQ